MARLRYLDRDDVEVAVHRLAAKLFSSYPDPLPPFELSGGPREGGALLESALALARQPYYPRLHDKAGALLRSLIKNHPLLDGNKRMGMTAAFVFLAINGHILVASNDEMVRFALEVASSEPDMTWQDVAKWLRARTIRRSAPKETVRSLLERLGPVWDKASLSARLDEYVRALSEVGTETGSSHDR